MTDLDPLRPPPPEGSELPARVARDPTRPSAERDAPGMDGPTGAALTTESADDPDRAAIESGAQGGAGAGALAGTAIAGPIGLPIGAAVGAIAGAAAEGVDEDRDTNEDRPLAEPGSGGTGSVDPATATAPNADPARGMAGERREAASDRS